VNDEVAVSFQVVDADGVIKPNLTDFMISIQLVRFTLKELTLRSSTIGDINTRDLRVFLNTLFRMVIPFANYFLAKGFQIPDHFFGVLAIKSAQFQAMDGFVEIGFVPEFL
jgi:hypothetical protein